MTTVGPATAINVGVPGRAVAIQAGHAVADHVYIEDVESTRLSIRMRGQSLGHHQALEGGALLEVALRADCSADLDARRDGGRARLLRRGTATGVGRDVQSDSARGLRGQRLRSRTRSTSS